MRRFILVLIATCTFPFGQTRPEFEVVSIKPAVDQIQQGGAGLHIDGSQVGLTSLSMKDIVGMAYQVKPNQIFGPDWISSQRYNIAAKIPDGGSQNQVREMIQSLLGDRFQMKMHREKRDFQVYALGAGKNGVKMTALPPDPDSDNSRPAPIAAGGFGSENGVAMTLGNGSTLSLGATSFDAKKLSMAQLAELLTRFMDRPVVDSTGLNGQYDFSLQLTPEDRTALLVRSAINAGITLPPQAMRALDSGSNASLTTSLEKLGITLQSTRAPLDVIVIDSILKTPTEN